MFVPSPVHAAALCTTASYCSPLQTGGGGVKGGGRVIAKARSAHAFKFIAGRARGELPVRGICLVLRQRHRRRRGGYSCASIYYMLLVATAAVYLSYVRSQMPEEVKLVPLCMVGNIITVW